MTFGLASKWLITILTCLIINNYFYCNFLYLHMLIIKVFKNIAFTELHSGIKICVT